MKFKPSGKGTGFADDPRDGPPLREWLEYGWSQEAAIGEVEVEGAVARYRVWGRGAGDQDRQKPGLVFAHGFLAHAHWWDHIAPHFSAEYTPIAVDFTGFGDSDRRPSYSRMQYGREIAAAAANEGVGTIDLVAHSFGSLSALYIASQRPDLVRRVVIVDAHVFREERPRAPREGGPQERFYQSREEALARYRLVPPGAWPHPDILAYFARHSLRESEQGWNWKFDPAIVTRMAEEPMREALHGLRVPVDYIHASRSEIAGSEEIEAFRRALPTCGTPVTVELSHHHIMIEQPVALVAALKGLLANPRQMEEF
ncbi:alpha/beta hydrolase [Novosphingobium sp. ZN18A2]|uniref:alpha/beta fold hydrolase n=1 Tax=Novosphingobium sp. ZN18A2 TaxID=3079861 RepID=UPI0030D47266